VVAAQVVEYKSRMTRRARADGKVAVHDRRQDAGDNGTKIDGGRKENGCVRGPYDVLKKICGERRLQGDQSVGGLRQMIVCLVAWFRLRATCPPQWKGGVARGILRRPIHLRALVTYVQWMARAPQVFEDSGL
jgi:hypothetical protein